MSQEFSDIRITGFDEERSLEGAHGSTYEFHLKLSPTPPPEWNQFFKEGLGMLSFTVSLSAGHIVFRCKSDALTQNHVNGLKQVVSNANNKYREHLAQKRLGQEAENQRALDAMRKLKF